jgi:hypothetical protein
MPWRQAWHGYATCQARSPLHGRLILSGSFRLRGLSLKALAAVSFLLVCAGLPAADFSTPPDRIVENYTTATESQQRSFDGTSMEVEIQASLPKLKKHGRLHGLRRISKLGRITYEHLVFEGDGTIKNQVIARYLTAEVEARDEQSPALAVTPANYKFGYKSKAMVAGRPAYLFSVTPKKKRPGLFKGELWIDAGTYLPLLESGYLVKSPSVFLKRVAFVRKFEIRDGISVPRQVASTVDTRIWGTAELEIDFTNFCVDDSTLPAESVEDDAQ